MQICLLIFKVNVMDIVSMKFHLNQVHDRVRNESQFKYYVSILHGGRNWETHNIILPSNKALKLHKNSNPDRIIIPLSHVFNACIILAHKRQLSN